MFGGPVEHYRLLKTWQVLPIHIFSFDEALGSQIIKTQNACVMFGG